MSFNCLMDICGFARIPLSLLLSVVDLHGSPYAFYGFLWICMDAWIAFKLFIEFCGFAWAPLNMFLSVVDLH